MPETSLLRALAYPYDGWSSSWGVDFCTRPGGLGIAYMLTVSGATGHAAALNGETIFHYREGNADDLHYVSDTTLYLSEVFLQDVPVSFRIRNSSAMSGTFDVHFVWLLSSDFFPFLLWQSVYNIFWPTPRLPFTLPAPGNAPFPYNASLPNEITLTPLNNNFLRQM